MNDLTPAEIQEYYRARVPDLKKSGRELRGPCPVHNGKDPNFSVNPETGMAQCHSRCGGFDIYKLEMALTGVSDFPTAKAEVYKIIGRAAPSYHDKDVEATYDYYDEGGALAYQVVRKFGKKFIQRRPKPGGGWIYGRGKVESVPFRLGKLLKAEKDVIISIVEGEKDVATLERLGWVATCNDGGAGNFKESLVRYFKDRHVAIFPDFDEPGRKHALHVAKLLHGTVASIKIVDLPGLALKGDVSDWASKEGNDSDKLYELYTEAQDWSPEFRFATEVPHENDVYIRSFSEAIEDRGGEEAFWNLAKVEGLPTPFEKLTDDLGGLRNGEIYIVAARTGQGKTSLLLQFALKLIELKKPVLYFSMEMDHTQMFQRLAGIHAQIDLSEYRRLDKLGYDPEKKNAIEKSLFSSTARLKGLPLLISNKTAITPEHLLTESMRIKEKANISAVIVDHAQLMGSAKQHRSEYEKVSSVSRIMKEIAQKLEVPILVASQVSRPKEKTGKTFELEINELRSSGALEEDAGAVVLLYKDDKDWKDADFHRRKRGPIKTWIKIGKNRYGPSGSYMPLNHILSQARFEEIKE